MNAKAIVAQVSAQMEGLGQHIHRSELAAARSNEWVRLAEEAERRGEWEQAGYYNRMAHHAISQARWHTDEATKLREASEAAIREVARESWYQEGVATLAAMDIVCVTDGAIMDEGANAPIA